MMLTNNITGEQETYQELYEKGERDFMGCSYFLLWGYQGFDNGNCEMPFEGPTKDSSTNRLIVSDAMFYNETDFPNCWRITHRFKEGSRQGNDIYFSFADTSQTVPKVALNAGYTDGRVERFSSQDTYEMKVAKIALYVSMYIPQYFR